MATKSKAQKEKDRKAAAALAKKNALKETPAADEPEPTVPDAPVETPPAAPESAPPAAPVETVPEVPVAEPTPETAIPAASEPFPAALANVKNETPVEMPPVPNPDVAFSGPRGTTPVNDEGMGELRDRQAAAAVAAGIYKPGVEPVMEAGQIVYEAPDGVLFAGAKDDIFKDPRNGRMIRPRRAAAPLALAAIAARDAEKALKDAQPA